MMHLSGRVLWWRLSWKFPQGWRTGLTLGEIQVFCGQATGGDCKMDFILMQMNQMSLLGLRGWSQRTPSGSASGETKFQRLYPMEPITGLLRASAPPWVELVTIWACLSLMLACGWVNHCLLVKSSAQSLAHSKALINGCS